MVVPTPCHLWSVVSFGVTEQRRTWKRDSEPGRTEGAGVVQKRNSGESLRADFGVGGLVV